MWEQFSRTEMLLGSQAMQALAAAHVAVFGVGGVGGYVVEALARSGVGALTLVDADVVDRSNLNRQIIALLPDVGRPKVQVAAERVAAINPEAQVECRQIFYAPDTANQFDMANFTYVVDAIDSVSGKLALVQQAQANVKLPPGSVAFVPSAAGLLLAAEVVKDIIRQAVATEVKTDSEY